MSGLPDAAEMEVHQLYEAAFEGNFPKMVFSLVGQHFRDASIVFADHDSAFPSRGFLLRRGPFAEDGEARSDQTFAKHWRVPVGHVYNEGDLGKDASGPPDDRQLSSRIIDETAEDRTGFVGVILRRHLTRQVVLELRFRRRLGNSLRPAMRAWFERMAPHLQRAVRIHDLRLRSGFECSVTANALELLPFCVFIIDDDRTVVKRNRRAEALAMRMESLFIAADGTLHASESDSDADFRSALHFLRRNQSEQSHQIAFRRCPDAGLQLLTIVRLRTTYADGAADYARERTLAGHFAVIAHDCTEALNLSYKTLSRTFGLTEREAELASSLVNGETIGDYASRRQLSKQTLRNQLGGIMRKTMTHRQPELVRLLTRLALTASH